MRVWKLLVGAAAVVAVAGGTVLVRDQLGLLQAGPSAKAAPAAFAMPVPVTKIVKKTIPIYLDYAGRTESIASIALQAKISGYVLEQHVPDGSDVKSGDLLYKIDPRDYQAALDQANAQAQRDSAALDYARSNYERGDQLGKSGFLPKDTLDQRNSTVHQSAAALAMDQAGIRAAQLNLGYTEIRAPFAGRLGRNQAPVGTLVSVGGSPLNTLVQLDPIYVTFNPSETDLAEIQKARAKGKVEVDVRVPGDTTPRYKGALTFIDNSVDRSTGTITARATIANADRTLLPGQYVSIRLLLREQPDTLMVPQTAIGSSQLGKYVYVVGDGNKVDQKLVSLGPTDGDLVSILKGVSDGDRVISGNLQKIGPGAPVQPLNQ
jgi:multidrug efflux system membrane fusion protein